jgi:hypothetical protein
MTTRIEEQVHTALERERAFDRIADFSRQADWDPNTVASRRLDDGPMGVGARFELQVRMGTRVVPMEYRITRYERPDRVVLVGEGAGVWSQDDISFRETPSGTRIGYVADIRLTGLLGSIQPLLGRSFRRIGRGAAAGMQRLLDQDADASEAT